MIADVWYDGTCDASDVATAAANVATAQGELDVLKGELTPLGVTTAAAVVTKNEAVEAVN